MQNADSPCPCAALFVAVSRRRDGEKSIDYASLNIVTHCQPLCLCRRRCCAFCLRTPCHSQHLRAYRSRRASLQHMPALCFFRYRVGQKSSVCKSAHNRIQHIRLFNQHFQPSCSTRLPPHLACYSRPCERHRHYKSRNALFVRCPDFHWLFVAAKRAGFNVLFFNPLL